MIMELPKKFSMPSVEITEDGELKIFSSIRFEDLMYELTYALRNSRECTYCGKELTIYNRTLDHKYPRGTGGISIVNNLFPCCPECNSKKGEFTHDEFISYMSLDKKDRNKYKKLLDKYKEKIMKKIGFKLPKKWVTYQPLRSIKYIKSEQDLRGKKYCRILEFYHTYKKLPRPIIIDKNNKLLDGYNLIMVAKELEFKEVPVIKLENVELCF